MNMDIHDINNRRNKVKNRNIKKNTPIFMNESYIPKDIEVCKSMLNNWSCLNKDMKIAFSKALSLTEEYVSSHPNDRDYITNYFIEEVVQSYPDIKSIKRIINKSNLGINVADKYSEFDKFVVSDRILSNQNKLDKKCNLSKYLKEHKTLSNDKDNIQMCIEHACHLINESYKNVSPELKYNVALENIYYSINSIYYNIPKEIIYEAVTDYFYAQDIIPFNEQVENKVLSQSLLYEKVNLKKNISKGANKVKDTILDTIRNTKEKTPDSIKKFITRIYTKSDKNIIEETPNILYWIRTGLVFSTMAINLWLGLIIILTDKFIEMGVKRKEATKMLDKYKKELDKAKKQKSKATSEKQKERLDKYIKELEKNYDKLKSYEESLYSEKELDARYDSEDNDDFNDFDDDDFSFDEETDINFYLDNYHDSIIEHAIYVSGVLSNKINSMFSYLKDSIIKVVSKEDIKSYAELNEEDLDYIIGSDSKISIPLAYVFSNDQYNGSKLESLINDLCIITNQSIQYLNQAYCLSFDGDDDMYTIYIDYCNRKICRCGNLIKESVQSDICRKLVYIKILEYELEKYINNKFILEDMNLNDILSEGDRTSILALESMCNNNYKLINRNRLIEASNSVLADKKYLTEATFSYHPLYIDIPINEGLIKKAEIKKEELYNELYVKRIIKDAQADARPFDKLYNIIHLLLSIPIVSVGGLSLAAGIIIFVITAAIAAATAPKPSKSKLKKLKILVERKLEEADACIRAGKDVDVMKVRKQELSSSLEMINKELSRLEKLDNEKSKKINKTKKEITKAFEDVDMVNNYIHTTMLNDIKYKSVNENYSNSNIPSNLFDVLDYLYDANTMMESFIEYENEKYKAIEEKTSIKTNIKLAANKIKNKLKRANDKQNELSNRLDASVERLSSDIHKKLANNNREAVIKGSLIPSASRLFKMAIGTGVLAAINPALAVVGLLGTIALSKRATKRERQYILDEIQIQLEIVEKKIQLAESNNDMKSLEQLLKIQKKLRREQQRIMYKMKAVYPVSAND